jgi:predicted GTPase
VSEWDRIATGLRDALASVQAEDFELEVQRECRLAVLGSPGSGKTSLSRTLQGGRRAEDGRTDDRVLEFRLPLRPRDIRLLESASLLVLLLDATNEDFVAEVAAADFLAYLGRPVVVCYSKIDLLPTEAQLVRGQARRAGACSDRDAP